jgi:aspartate ammonia-lyase
VTVHLTDAKDRRERDLLGERMVPAGALWGVHTLRAIENFPLTGRAVHPDLVAAYGAVKLACASVNASLGCWRDDPEKAAAIERACREMAEGRLTSHIVVDALQGGAGTSTNMNVNEVLANRALEILGRERGDYAHVSPLDDINRHQSTNDTYPTALRVAALRLLETLEAEVVVLQEAFQDAERRFAHVVKVGRTEYQDAVLVTLGREMGAYAEALSRDRWRIYKCNERLRVVNLGGTAVGTGVGAPREFIFRAVEKLREIVGLPLARAENLFEATQNADVFVEVSGILKALAATLWKISSDLRLLSSGPSAGLGEIRLPQLQAGSSIMPGKVNPVVPEAVAQCAMLVFAYDGAIGMAAASGTLELNPFLPLIAVCLLEEIDLLANACGALRIGAVVGMEADEERCAAQVANSTAAATALAGVVGYEQASEVVSEAQRTGGALAEMVVERGWMTAGEFAALISPESVCRLGGGQ